MTRRRPYLMATPAAQAVPTWYDRLGLGLVVGLAILLAAAIGAQLGLLP